MSVNTPTNEGGSRRRMALAAAVVAVLVAGTVLVLATSDDDAGQPPADTLPPAISTPTTVATPSAPADRQFAGAVALRPNDWGPQYHFGKWSPLFSMPRELAETLPECEPFLDTVFESPARPATVTTAAAAAGHWQYVVVFADDAEAEAMMGALHDPRYPECDARYRSMLSSQLVGGVGDRTGVRPQLELAGDDSVIVGTTVFIRAGRTVMTFDSQYDDDELVAIVALAVARVEAAEAGAPLPSTPLPLEYLTKAALTAVYAQQTELAVGASGVGADWESTPGAGQWKLDRPRGLSVPSCDAFVDVFLAGEIHHGWGENHDETISLAFDGGNWTISPRGAAGPGVFRVMMTGYARQHDAQDAMDAISDPGFPRCLADYTSAEPPTEVWQATTREPISVSALSSLGDENVQMLFEGSYTDHDGTTTPAGRIAYVFVRVDQVLIGVEVTVDHMSTAELESVVQQMVAATEAAIAGAPLPLLPL